MSVHGLRLSSVFRMVAPVMLETTCCYLYLRVFLSIPEFMGDLDKGTALQSP